MPEQNSEQELSKRIPTIQTHDPTSRPDDSWNLSQECMVCLIFNTTTLICLQVLPDCFYLTMEEFSHRNRDLTKSNISDMPLSKKILQIPGLRRNSKSIKKLPEPINVWQGSRIQDLYAKLNYMSIY